MGSETVTAHQTEFISIPTQSKAKYNWPEREAGELSLAALALLLIVSYPNLNVHLAYLACISLF